MKSSNFAGEFNLPAYNLSPAKVTKFLLTIIALLEKFRNVENKRLGELTKARRSQYFEKDNSITKHD